MTKKGLLAFLAAFLAAAQTRIPIEEAVSRAGADFNPAYLGKEVTVTGQVSARPLPMTEGFLLPIQSETFHGILLEDSGHQIDGLEPGEWVEVRGVVLRRGGLPVLQPHEIKRLSRTLTPLPWSIRPTDVASFRFLGVLVQTESTVLESGPEGVLIGDRKNPITVYLPRARRDSGPTLDGIRQGDRIRVTGIASQASALPPYDRSFQLLVASPAAVTILDRSWMIPPPFLLASLLIGVALLVIWWVRERRMAALRREMRFLNTLGEEVIGANSPAEILRRLTLGLPQLTGISGIGIYTHNQGAGKLESVHAGGAATESIDIEAPRGPMAAGIAACFRNRALVTIPDTRRNPAFQTEDNGGAPRSVLLIPMLAQGDLVGVLELHDSDRFRFFSQSEQAAMQHLANQIATALRLQAQQSIREQLFRSEKLAAAGQLISDVANELRSPLESIVNLASSLQEHQIVDSNAALKSIAGEARRASEIVGRLVSVANVEQSEAQPVDLNVVLSDLLKFRAPEWTGKGVEIRAQYAPKSATAMGSAGQLEQVLLNLLVDAEKSAVEAREKVIHVSTSLLAKRVLVEISYPTRSTESQRIETVDGDHAGSGALGLGVCRGIIQSHGGEFRIVRVSPTQARFDIELPVSENRRAANGTGPDIAGASRQLTILIVEPDTKVQRQLVQLLGNRGDRVVPVSNAEEGADLVQRLRFDLAFSAVRLPGCNWIEFFERIRYKVGGFVLLTDAYNNDLARAFQNGEGFVLNKPIDEQEVHRICRIVEERATISKD
jgi:signal transduction histidine kinase/CheY-like chemotaxis protein